MPKNNINFVKINKLLKKIIIFFTTEKNFYFGLRKIAVIFNNGKRCYFQI